MRRRQTPNQVEEDYRAAMGDDLGGIFFWLWNECAWLHWKWREYEGLFGKSEKRVALLNKTAPGVFRVLQDSLWESVLLHICRLTDPPKTCGKHNLTLLRLPDLASPSVRGALEAKLETTCDACRFARDWRVRRIAHRDLALAIGDGAEPLAVASRESVESALKAIADTLNVLDEHYKRSTMAYGMMPLRGGAEELLYVIRDGLEAGRRREARFASGKLLPEDYEAPGI